MALNIYLTAARHYLAAVRIKIHMTSQNSFSCSAGKLTAGNRTYEIFRLAALEKAGVAKLSSIPYSIKILFANLLRFEDGVTVKRADIEYVAALGPLGCRAGNQFPPGACPIAGFHRCAPARRTSPPCAMPWSRWAQTQKKPIR